MLSITLSMCLLASPFVNHLYLSVHPNGVDVVSHASGGGGGTTPTVRPGEVKEKIEGTPIAEEDKALEYESDFVKNIVYNNEFGYLMMDINEDFLNNGFVNQIRYIGINDTKYEYSDINTDRSHWYRIFIPYRFVEEGHNDFYFYLDDVTYRVPVLMGEEFLKKRPAPRLIPLENVDGTDVKFEIKLLHHSEEDRRVFYERLREETTSKVEITEVFTMSKLDTRIDSHYYDASIDEENNVLTIQFKNDKKIYQGFYVYLVNIPLEGFENAWVYVILYEHAEPLTLHWQTEGDNSLRIGYGENVNSIYLGEVSKVELIALSDAGQAENTRELTKEEYTQNWSQLVIKSSVFESKKKYKVRLSHPSVQTVELETTSPDLAQLKPAKKILLEDITDKQDLVIRFSEADKPWLENLSESGRIILQERRGKEHTLRNIQQKAKDDEDNGYVAPGEYGPKNPNKYYSLDPATNTFRIEGKYFDSRNTNSANSEKGRWSLTFEVKGYEDSKTAFYINYEKPGPWDPQAPELAAEFMTSEDYSLKLTAPKDKMHSMLWIYERRGVIVNAPSIYLTNVRTKETKELTPGKDKDFWSTYVDGGYELKIFAHNFEAGETYRIRLSHREYPSAVLEKVVAPTDQPTVPKTAQIKVPDVISGASNVVIQSESEDFLDNISKLVFYDERGFNVTIDEKTKVTKAIIVPYSKAIDNDEIQRKLGEFRVVVSAKGYRDVEAKFTVKASNVEVKEPRLVRNQLNFSFFQNDLPEYGYPETVTEVWLNGNKLSDTQYIRGVMATLSIQDRVLLDGKNTVTFKSGRYAEITTEFQFDNQKLREEKAEAIRKIEQTLQRGELPKEQAEALQKTIREATTLRALRSAVLTLDVAEYGVEKAKTKLKEEALKKLEGSDLGAEEKELLKNELSAQNNLDKIQEVVEKIDAAIQNHIDAVELEKIKAALRDTIQNANISAADRAALLQELEQLTKDKIKELEGKITQAIQRNTPSSGGNAAPTSPVRPPAASRDDKSANGQGETVISGNQVPKASAGSPARYSDVSDDAEYYSAVQYLYEKDIMSGVTADQFMPGNVLTRAMSVAILHRIDKEEVQGATHSFTDVKKGAWYENAVLWANAKKIASGRTPNKFSPSAQVTHQEFIAMLARYAQSKSIAPDKLGDLSRFADGREIAAWAQTAYQQMAALGVFREDMSKLNPRSVLTRSEAAMYLERFLKAIEK